MKKPVKKAAKRPVKKKTRVNWRKASIELASCVLFALRFNKHLGKGSGVVFNFKTRTSEGRWEEKFFNALALIGLEYDRKGYYASPQHRRRG